MPRRSLLALALALLLAPAAGLPAGRAAEGEDRPSRLPGAVTLAFGWTAPLSARVTYRRTRTRSGARGATFTARYVARLAAQGRELRLGNEATTWEGDLPFPTALTGEAIFASEQVVQRIGTEGQFLGLDGVEAIRPVLRRMFEELMVPPEQAERAVALAEASMRAQAEELWNLAVGFWTGASLELGETYQMETETELPFAPGTRAQSTVEFEVRRRVPCGAGERGARCVEITLRAVPERAAVERAAPLLRERLGAPAAPVADAGELSVEQELLLVTEPTTLLPRRLVWTQAIRAAPAEGGPGAEQVDRSEYDYRYDAPAPRRRRAPGPPPTQAAPAPASGRAPPAS